MGYPKGNFKYRAMIAKGAKNDDASSIKVPPGCKAIVYQHGDFTGWRAEFPAGNYPFRKFIAKGAKNDDASSLKVIDAGAKATVRYGAKGQYATKTLFGSTSCSNRVFGDPKPGVKKKCEYKIEAKAGHVEPLRLQFIATQTNSADFGCSPTKELEIGKWTFITLVMANNKLTVFYDGAQQCTKTN